MEHKHALLQSHCVDGPERIAAVVGDHLQDARAKPLQRLGRDVLLAALYELSMPYLACPSAPSRAAGSRTTRVKFFAEAKNWRHSYASTYR